MPCAGFAQGGEGLAGRDGEEDGDGNEGEEGWGYVLISGVHGGFYRSDGMAGSISGMWGFMRGLNMSQFVYGLDLAG